MGLNWAEGLKQVGVGLESVGAAREKTLELDYRNARDVNLNRFRQETRQREDDALYDTGTDRSKLILEAQKNALEAKQQREDELAAKKQDLADESLYNTGSARSKALMEKEESDLKLKFDRDIKVALAKSKNKNPMPSTEQEYVDKEMEKWLSDYSERAPSFDEDNPDASPMESITKVEINNAIARFRFQWKSTRLNKTTATSPFSVEGNDPDELRSLIQQK